jgi:hypothetical protein
MTPTQPVQMTFRARLALLLLLAPVLLAWLIMGLDGAISGSLTGHHWRLGTQVAFFWGALLAGGSWVLLSALKWLVMGR